MACNFSRLVDEYCAYAEHVFRPVMGVWFSPTSGCPLVAGFLNANFDAHVSENGEIGLGLILRRSIGEVVFLVMKRVAAKWDATLAEAMAA